MKGPAQVSEEQSAKRKECLRQLWIFMPKNHEGKKCRRAYDLIKELTPKLGEKKPRILWNS